MLSSRYKTLRKLNRFPRPVMRWVRLRLTWGTRELGMSSYDISVTSIFTPNLRPGVTPQHGINVIKRPNHSALAGGVDEVAGGLYLGGH